MYISSLKISNVRCFKELSINLEKKGKPILWTTILGDNSSGKSTLLRSIAIGLCDESSAAGLLRESEQGLIRTNRKRASITVGLKENGSYGEKIIKTNIIEIGSKKSNFEKLRHDDKSNFKEWNKLFVCGYGIGRGTSGTGDISGYSAINAMYNLFNYSEGLQNPELIFLRLAKGYREREEEAKNVISHILDLGKGEKIFLEKDGIKIKGPWKSKMPLRDVADGYRSTFQWVIDFIGWAISFNPKVYKSKSIKGIILLDSLEEHLHPRWQRLIIQKLQSIFPLVQFIITTHSPLIAAGTADLENSQIIKLELGENNKVRRQYINKEEVKGLRSDQILRTSAFNLTTTKSLDSVSDIIRYAEFKSKIILSDSEKNEMLKLRNQLSRSRLYGDTNYEDDIQKAFEITLNKMLKMKPTELHKLILEKKLSQSLK